MATAKKISTIAGTGFDMSSDYAAQRNMKKSKWNWAPGNGKLRQIKWDGDWSDYMYDQNNYRMKLKNTQNSYSDYSFKDQGEWNLGSWTNTDGSNNIASHGVDKNKPYYHFSIFGWSPFYTNSQALSELRAASCVPITNFQGITFKWDGWGSYWNNIALNMVDDKDVVRSTTNDKEGGVTLTVYNAQTNKIHSLFTFREAYRGWDIFSERQDTEGNGSGNTSKSDNNWAYFRMHRTDRDYVLNNPVFLIGLTFQMYNDDRGSATHTRRINFWDLNPVFHDDIGGNFEQGGPKLVLPSRQSNALQTQYDIHARGQRKPVAINLG